MSVLNSDILTRAWMNGSNSFQQRIPNPSIASYANVVENLFAPMNADLYNEFSGLLNGLIGTYIDVKRFENPLRELKSLLQAGAIASATLQSSTCRRMRDVSTMKPF